MLCTYTCALYNIIKIKTGNTPLSTMEAEKDLGVYISCHDTSDGQIHANSRGPLKYS